ncbi:hypothetical protein C8R47DRAFT_1220022 [Mycena vitilis]|nr:hypothetical protein C8R47DRAFT_1220022 [Mycena vitilis]
MLPRSRGPSPKRAAALSPAALSGSASFDPSGALDPAETHPVLHSGRVAVVTGAASGIGAAAARAFAALNMKIALADLPASLPALKVLAAELAATVGEANVLVIPTDVSVLADVQHLRETVYDAWHEVGVLMNNAGVGGLAGTNGEHEWFRPPLYGERGTAWDGLDAWHAVFNVNLFGVLNVQQVFVPVRLFSFHSPHLSSILICCVIALRVPLSISFYTLLCLVFILVCSLLGHRNRAAAPACYLAIRWFCWGFHCKDGFASSGVPAITGVSPRYRYGIARATAYRIRYDDDGGITTVSDTRDNEARNEARALEGDGENATCASFTGAGFRGWERDCRLVMASGGTLSWSVGGVGRIKITPEGGRQGRNTHRCASIVVVGGRVELRFGIPGRMVREAPSGLTAWTGLWTAGSLVLNDWRLAGGAMTSGEKEERALLTPQVWPDEVASLGRLTCRTPCACDGWRVCAWGWEGTDG